MSHREQTKLVKCLEMRLPVKTLSINSTYYGNKNHGKTAEARDWFYSVFYALSQDAVKAGLKEMREMFDPAKHAYEVEIVLNIPKSLLYTKEGYMSSRVHDLSNIEKSLVDAIFLPSNFGTNVPYNCENLNLDDRYLKRLTSEKVTSKDGNWSIDVDLRLIEIRPE